MQKLYKRKNFELQIYASIMGIPKASIVYFTKNGKFLREKNVEIPTFERIGD